MSNPHLIPQRSEERSSRTWLRRAALQPHHSAKNRPMGEVLYFHPLSGLRGKPLQFQSFDEAYVERLRAGDLATQQDFVAYFSHLIQLKLRSRLRSSEAIDDVRQETFTRVLTALRDGKILHPERLGPFVNATCTHVLQEHYRATSHAASGDEEEQKECPDTSSDVFAVFSQKQTGEKVREVLDQLAERDKRLLREVFLEERDKDEVCRNFGVDRDYLRVLLHRAKQAFKSLYYKNMKNGPRSAATA
ncbi:MAG TPA: sigma-70 family RNA polymerase sigma factor [Candidatus Binatia bacterium]|nr:sigma-70 family RNA polymerase sigma factor [Candidatus Binatia bacterium]